MSCMWVFTLSWVHVWGVWSSTLSWGKLWGLRPPGAGCGFPIKPQFSIEILLTGCMYDLDTWSLIPVNKLRCIQCALWGSNEKCKKSAWSKLVTKSTVVLLTLPQYEISGKIKYLSSPSKWQMWLLLKLWSCLKILNNNNAQADTKMVLPLKLHGQLLHLAHLIAKGLPCCSLND